MNRAGQTCNWRGRFAFGIVPGFLICMLAVISRLYAGDVLQHHADQMRDGLYIDPLITQKAAAAMHQDRSFNSPLQGPVYAQPLYVSNGPGGKPALIVATERNMVLALDAASGAQLWSRKLGDPVPLVLLPCGNIDPLGITGTPVIDPNTRTIYVAAMTSFNGGLTKQHLIFALSLDDGATRPGWPVNASAMKFGNLSFNAANQNQRGALLLLAGTLYVPYGGHWGDCGDYHGWVVAVPTTDPRSATAWATQARGGGSWAPGGLSSDGHSIFAATGNTFRATTWMGGDAIIRLAPGAKFSGDPADYFAPSDWKRLDDGDVDLGGSGPVLFDAPGATPSELAVALGKNGMAYLLDRNRLGGIGKGNGTDGEGLRSKQVAGSQIINAAAAYTTKSATYVVFESNGDGIGCPGARGNLVALRIGKTSPPTIDVAWCADNKGRGSPMVTTTDGKNEPIVWSVGAETSNRLQAFDGETGKVLFAGGGKDEQMSLVQHMQTPIAAGGRIFVAADGRLYAFSSR